MYIHATVNIAHSETTYSHVHNIMYVCTYLFHSGHIKHSLAAAGTTEACMYNYTCMYTCRYCNNLITVDVIHTMSAVETALQTYAETTRHVGL